MAGFGAGLFMRGDWFPEYLGINLRSILYDNAWLVWLRFVAEEMMSGLMCSSKQTCYRGKMWQEVFRSGLRGGRS